MHKRDHPVKVYEALASLTSLFYDVSGLLFSSRDTERERERCRERKLKSYFLLIPYSMAFCKEVVRK